ncbi:hypothetical protein B1L04_05655 [Microcystis aeruginosa KW]|uniref:Staphylococcus aureus surface protein A n=2 Tax=Microcystis aeruginosa TaxID=1126 RepID=A0A1V4BW36_MICAE|nr:hypothetical protein B1L04_05655 [Microcystis aeruginosa KW]
MLAPTTPEVTPLVTPLTPSSPSNFLAPVSAAASDNLANQSDSLLSTPLLVNQEAANFSFSDQNTSWLGTPQITQLDDLGEVLVVPGNPSERVNMVVQWTLREAAFNNEIGFFLVDASGRVEGIAPGEEGFAEAALSSSSRQTLFNSGNQAGNWREFTVAGGSRLGFYLIQNSTSANWLENNRQNQGQSGLAFFSLKGANPDNFDHSQSSHLGRGIWRFNWEDLTGGGDQDFNDVVFNIAQAGIVLPGDKGQQVPLTVEAVSQDADFQSEMGYYLVDTPDGEINGIKPGDQGYLDAALSGDRHQVIFASGKAFDSKTFNVPSGKYLGWYLVANGTTEAIAKGENAPPVFFSYAAANEDGLNHVHAQQDSQTWAWEDFWGGGDRDFNDLVFRFSFGEPTGEPIQLPSLSIENTTVTEGNIGTEAANFTVRLSAPTNTTVTAQFTTTDGTAQAGTDYESSTGILTFAPGEVEKNIAVAVKGDTISEPTETFTVNLTGVTNAILIQGEGIGTIIDNDNSPNPPDNNPPVTDADKTITLPEDSQPIPLNINPPTDIDGDTLTVSVTQLPDNSKGRITLADGTVINVGDEISINSLTSLLYRPLADVNGNGGNFVYTVSDGKGGSDSQTISFVITPENTSVNNPPVTDADKTITLPEDSQPIPLNINPPTDIDGDTLTVSVTQLPDNSKGKITLADGTVINVGDEISINSLTSLLYTPLADVNGSGGNFVYTVSDGKGGSDSQTISFIITPENTSVNNPPVTDADKTITLPEDSQPIPLNINPPTDIDGDTLTVSVTQLPDNSKGKITLADGTVINVGDEISINSLTSLLYRPLADVNGNGGNFVYTVSDGKGGNDSQTISFVLIAVSDNSILLREDNIFSKQYQQTISVPVDSSFLSFTYNDLNFDTTDPDSINDAFEVALVDAQGNSLIHTIQPNRDAFFNITENQPSAVASGVSIAGMTVKVNLTGVTPGDATLIFRLVNNDSDTQTSVRIRDIQLLAGDETIAPPVTPEIEPAAISQIIDFSQLSDINSSLNAEYLRTSFNEDSKTLYADFVVRNQGEYVVDSPLVVAIKSISNPTVQVVGATGITPEGLPYYNLSDLVDSNTLDPDEITQSKTLAFLNPQEVQFTYKLVFLGKLNTAPNFISDPDIEALINKPYIYDADATDLEGDTLTYSLLTAPNGMTIESDTGKISWTPGTNTVGNYSISVQVNDGRGGIDQQDYTLSVIAPPPNRPPIITSIPIVDARVKQEYQYQAIATDPDSDTLTYSLVNAPNGMTIDANTGLIRWTATANQTGLQEVELEVNDGKGGIAEQKYQILVGAELGNQNPIFVSIPVTQYNLPGISNPASGNVNPNGLDLSLLLGETFKQNVSLTLPTGGNSTGSADVVFVVDESGSMSGEHFWLAAMVRDLEAALKAKAITNNRYALAGFGGAGIREPGHLFSLGANFNLVGDAEDLANATQLLQTSGGTEDGYDGINVALTGLSFRPGAAVNVILVTDEDRDIISPRLTFSSILQDLTNQQALLNAVVSANFRDTSNQIVLGVDSDNNAYRANGTGGYIITPIGIVSSSDTTKRDYIDLALATAGAAWNLDQLRVGGLTATSFTKAFVDIKAKEIIEQLPLTVIASDPTVSFKNLTGVVSGVDSGETATFNIELTSDGLARSFDLLFVRPSSSTILGSIPVTFNNDYFYLSQAIDPDNDTLTYSLLEAPTEATIDSQSGQIHWKPKQGGNYQFSIQLDDGRGGRTLQDYTVTVNVGSPNNAPTITSGASNQAAIGRPYTYDIKATDPDQDILAYYLTQASDGVSLDRLTGRLTWTPTQAQLGNQTIKIRVLDGRGGEATQTLNLTVTPDLTNQNPQIQGTPLTEITLGEVYRYQFSAMDGNGDPLTFDLPLQPEGMTLESTTGTILWQPTREQVGSHEVVLRVRDGHGGLALQSFQIQVNSLNTAPIITSNPDLDTVVNLPYQYQIQAQDADGDPLTFRLDTAPTGVTLDATTGILRWTPINSQVGQHTFTLIASDDKGGETRQTYNLNVLAFAPNHTPEITSTPRNSVALGTSYFYTLNTSDPDGDPLAINLQNAPTGMTLNQQGFITWTPEANQLGNHTVKVQVNDGRSGFIEQEWTIAVVSQRSNNQAPQILSTPSLKANINQVYQYNLVGNDPDGDPIFWSLETRPQGMSLDVTKGTIRWQPKFDQIGLHEVVIQVIDTQGATSSQRFTLAVNGVNLPPNITSVPFTRTVTNQTYTYTVVAKDPENGILTYNLGRKPNGMTIDQKGKIQWTPTQIGNYDIDVLVADNQGATTTQTYQLVVGTQAINQAPNITSTPLFVANVGSPYQYQIQASDPDGQSLTYQLIESPQGMTINANTGLVQWNTPITGNYKVVVAAFDSQGLGVTQGYTLAAKVNSLPVIRSTNPPTGAIPGVAYRYDIQATDPDGGILTYSLDPASQAKGITLDESGRLSWTPSNSQTGIHAITLTITDAAGGKVTQSFNLTVAPDTTAPKVIINRNKNFTNKGEAVSFQVSATDNVGIANLQLLINNTPVVIDSNGVATFTPTNPGVITAKAFASDAAGNKAEATTTVNVLDPTDTEAPSVSLDLSAITNGQITAPTPIKGTVNDTNLAYYALEVAPADGSAPFKEMFRGTTPVTNGVLGVLDPTLLPNDTYQVRLIAYDVNGKGNGVAELLDVSGDLKLGNFQLSFTDLEIPVGGIPITLTRTYDTLNSNNKDDFGFGWRMEFRDADVRTSLPKDELYEQLGFRSVGFKEGDAVYLTLPGGKREKFTLKLEAINSLVNALLGRYGLYKPTFVADKGSTSTLSVETAGVVLTRGQNGQVVPFSGGSAFAHYHPQDWGNYYQLTTKEGIVYNIDATTGDINSITNRNSDKLTFTDAGITSSNGLKVTFGRDTQGRITTVTDPMGKQIKYEYDSKGDLIKVTDRENNTTQFKYNNDQPHYLDEIIDPLGRTGIKNEYDQNGRLTKVFNGEGKAVQLEYNPDNFVYSVKDTLGNSTTYESDARGNIITEIDANGGIIKRTYDDSNNLLSETNPEGEKLSYTYDSKGNKLSETDALGNVTRYNYNSNNDLLTTTDALGNVTTNTYDSRGNLLSITGLSNGTVTLAYNNNGLLTQLTTGEGTTKYEYDFRGNITKEINPLGQETTYTYDGNGNRLTETRKVTTTNGIRTLVTKTEYDSKGNIIKVTDAEGNISQTIYDAAGQKIKEIDALGRVTKYVYSEGGQLLETIYPDATPNNDSDNPRTRKEYDAANRVTADIDELGRPTQYQYDALGRLIYTIYPDLTPNDNTDNPRKETRYDKAGRVIAEVDERGNITRYTYDDAGRRTETILPDSTPNNDTDNPRILVTYDALGHQISQTDPLGRKTEFIYDNLGRSTGQIFADNTSISTTFDQAGRVIAKIDQEGNKTKYEYNALGQLTAVIDALNNRTEYGYNELGNLITQKDAKANITKYEYDGIGRRIATQLPLNQHSTTQYDQVGNIVSTTDFNGEIITFIYDERNRLIRKALPNNEQVIYTYTLTGQRATETDSNGTITYQYDSRNRLLSRIDPDGVKIEYTYDAAGNRTSVNIPSGKTSYTFDEQNRLKTVTDFSNGVTNYTYDLAGNLSKTTLPNGTIETREYDLLNRLLYLQNSNSSGVINSFRYTLDKVGNRLAVVEQDGRKVNYEYDDIYRLLEEEVIDGTTRTISYTYDAVSNRLTRNDSGEGNTTYEYDQNDRLLKEVTNGVTTTYTYDNNGNTLSKTTGTDKVNYQWNAENRLIGLDNNGDGVNDVTNKYDSDGIRISQTVNGDETRFLVDKNRDYAQVLQEYTPSKIIKASYVYGHDLISQLRNSQRSFYHVDGLGSTRALTDSNGLVSDRYAYEAFGEIIKQLGNTKNLYLFAGEQRDPNLGLDYLRARYYDPQTGKFTVRDTFEGNLQIPITLHRYIYANANPILYIDPSGNFFSLSGIGAALSILSTLVTIGSVAYNLAEGNYTEAAEDAFLGIAGGVLGLGLVKVIGPASKIRLQYVNFININMTQRLEQLRLAGRSSEEIAQSLIWMRNSIKLETRAIMQAQIPFGNKLVEFIEKRNFIKYGDPLGPNISYFAGRNWETVIEKAFDSNYLINRLLLPFF